MMRLRRILLTPYHYAWALLPVRGRDTWKRPEMGKIADVVREELHNMLDTKV